MKGSADKISIDFMAAKVPAFMLSAVLILASITSLFVQGLSFGIDFTGGTLVEVGYKKGVELESVRGALGEAGFDDATVQYFGSARDVLIRVAPRGGMNSADISNRILQSLEDRGQEVEMRRVEFVGPQVGERLKENGGLAMLVATAFILIYVAARFQLRFSVGAIAALIHDVLIVIGFFSIFRIEFDLSVLAAVLAVIGYSLNDTIVIFDRVRENFHRMRKAGPLEVVNVSINQTLSRTLITSGTTLLVLLALFFYGGEIIHPFSIALIVGVISGTYSTLYIANPIILALGISRQDLMPVEKEGAELDELP